MYALLCVGPVSGCYQWKMKITYNNYYTHGTRNEEQGRDASFQFEDQSDQVKKKLNKNVRYLANPYHFI